MTHLSPISAEISKQKTLEESKDQRLLSSGPLNRVQNKQTQQSFNECVFQTFLVASTPSTFRKHKRMT